MGFTVRQQPPRPAVVLPVRPVLAEPGKPTCGLYHNATGCRCERPIGHAGGHLNKSAGAYWQQEEA